MSKPSTPRVNPSPGTPWRSTSPARRLASCSSRPWLPRRKTTNAHGCRSCSMAGRKTDRMPWTLGQLQDRIRLVYGAKDGKRGIEGTFMWFMEEVGELSASLRSGPKEHLAAEFADVL